MKKRKREINFKGLYEYFQNNKLKIIAFIILWLYMYFIFVMQTICNDIEINMFFAAFLIPVSFIISFGLLYFCNRFFNVKFKNYKISKNQTIKLCVLVFIITFCFYLFYFIAQYPGGMIGDIVQQLTQAYSGLYSNWHPVLHTLLFFTLPIKLGGGFSLIVFLGLLYFCLAFTYLIYVLYKNRCPKILLYMLCIYIWINPYLATYLMYPWKDTAMTIFATILFGFYIQIVCTKGTWLQKNRNIFLCVLVTVLCTCMRHNAILFTAPLFILILFYAPKKQKIKVKLNLLVVVSFILICILYYNLHMGNPTMRTMETSGLPATIWSNVMKKNPDALPEETQEYMYTIAPAWIYENIYETGNFNSIKWNDAVDPYKIDDLSYSKILYYTWQCFKYAPKDSFEAFSKLTSVVWSITDVDSPIEVTTIDNEWEITDVRIISISTFFNELNSFLSQDLGRIIFGSYGLMNFSMLMVGLILLCKKKLSIIHIIPFLCYNFGTMLLLTTSDSRFFLFNIVLWIPVIFLMIKDQ